MITPYSCYLDVKRRERLEISAFLVPVLVVPSHSFDVLWIGTPWGRNWWESHRDYSNHEWISTMAHLCARKDGKGPAFRPSRTHVLKDRCFSLPSPYYRAHRTYTSLHKKAKYFPSSLESFNRCLRTIPAQVHRLRIMNTIIEGTPSFSTSVLLCTLPRSPLAGLVCSSAAAKNVSFADYRLPRGCCC